MNEITKELLDALKLAKSNALGMSSTWHVVTAKVIAKAEAALFTPQPSDDGWIPWEGGDCPVAHGTVVDVRLRNQGEGRAVASNWHWLHETRGNSILEGADIIAYRVVKP